MQNYENTILKILTHTRWKWLPSKPDFLSSLWPNVKSERHCVMDEIQGDETITDYDWLKTGSVQTDVVYIRSTPSENKRPVMCSEVRCMGTLGSTRHLYWR